MLKIYLYKLEVDIGYNYNKLWRILIAKKINKEEFHKNLGLTFIGTTTVLIPDTEHNTKEEKE